jgi:hypothetical protein
VHPGSVRARKAKTVAASNHRTVWHTMYWRMLTESQPAAVARPWVDAWAYAHALGPVGPGLSDRRRDELKHRRESHAISEENERPRDAPPPGKALRQ